MPYSSTRAALGAGVLSGLPFCIIIVPFAALFGVLATAAGLDLVKTMAFSVLLIAGAAQLTAIQLMAEQAPVIVVLISALAVNLRMAMYSASLAQHLGAAPLWQRILIGYLNVDQSYAASVVAYERRPDMPLDQKVAYFLGIMIPIAPTWYGATFAGAVTGAGFLPSQGLDFILPMAFLAIIAPALRTRTHFAAAAVATGLGLALAWMPYSLGLLPAAIGGMITGAELDRRSGRIA